MASLFDRFMGRKDPTSADLARERLKLVLVTDRSDLSPEKLEQLQAEIIHVIQKYLRIDGDAVLVNIEQRDRKMYLVANVPLERDRMYKKPRDEANAVLSEAAASGDELPGTLSDTVADTKPRKPDDDRTAAELEADDDSSEDDEVDDSSADDGADDEAGAEESTADEKPKGKKK